MNKSMLVEVVVENPIRFKTIFPIIIPFDCKTLDFKISNIDSLKGYDLYVLQVEKGNKDNKKIRVIKDMFSIPLNLIEDNNFSFLLYSIKGEEINTYKLDKSYLKVNKLINLTNEEKFSSIMVDVLNRLYNLDNRVKELEEEINANALL